MRANLPPGRSGRRPAPRSTRWRRPRSKDADTNGIEAARIPPSKLHPDPAQPPTAAPEAANGSHRSLPAAAPSKTRRRPRSRAVCAQPPARAASHRPGRRLPRWPRSRGRSRTIPASFRGRALRDPPVQRRAVQAFRKHATPARATGQTRRSAKPRRRGTSMRPDPDTPSPPRSNNP